MKQVRGRLVGIMNSRNRPKVHTVEDVYGQLFEGIDQEAADRFDETVRRAGAEQVRTKRQPNVIDLNG